MVDFKILTFNCQGIGQVNKRLDIFNYLKSKNCQIYCLQDIHSTSNTETLINSEWENKGISHQSVLTAVAALFYLIKT